MKSAKLKIVLHSGKGLKDVKHFGIMNPYAKIWIAAGDTISLKHKTSIAKKGDTNPVWEYDMEFENVSINKANKLFIEVKHDGTVFDRSIGAVQIPFADLLNKNGSGERLSYWLTTSDVVERPGEDGSTTQVPPAKKKREKAKKVAKRAATRISTFAVEMAVATVIGEAIDLD